MYVYAHVCLCMHACMYLQHTALHCTTLRHTATHCTTLHHTAPHCTTLHRTAPRCTALHHTAPHCTTQHHRVPPDTTWHHTAPHSTARHHTTSHYTRCTTLSHTISDPSWNEMDLSPPREFDPTNLLMSHQDRVQCFFCCVTPPPLHFSPLREFDPTNLLMSHQDRLQRFFQDTRLHELFRWPGCVYQKSPLSSSRHTMFSLQSIQMDRVCVSKEPLIFY